MAKTRPKKISRELVPTPAPNPQGPWARLAFTAVAALVCGLVRQISLPTVDVRQLVGGGLQSGMGTSIVALGIMPIISAALVVEVAAVLVPRWRHLRHGGTIGRARLQRAIDILTLLLAVFQGYATSTWLQAQSAMAYGGLQSQITTTLTLVAGVMLLKFIADFASARGLVNGYGVIIGTWGLIDIGRELLMMRDLFTIAALGLLLGKVLGIAALTWFVLERWKNESRLFEVSALKEGADEQPDTENPYAAPNAKSESKEGATSGGIVFLPSPASGLVPYWTAFSLLAIPMTLPWVPGFAKLADLLDNRLTRGVVTIGLLGGLTVLVTGLFQQPQRVAAVYSRMEGAQKHRGRIEAEAQSVLPNATARALLYLLGLWVLDLATQSIGAALVDMGSIVLTTAVALDLMQTFRILGKRRDWVAIWPEHRPYALAAATKSLEDVGIPVYVRDHRQRQLLQFSASYVPMEIMVPHEHAERAGEILYDVLREEPADGRENVQKSSRAFDTTGRRVPREKAVLAGIVLLILGALYLSMPAPTPKKEARARTTNLEFVLVDDEDSIVDNATDEALEKKYGILLASEQVSLGPGKTAVRQFARVLMNDGETFEMARKRLESWIQAIKLPEGTRAALTEYQEFDRGLGKMRTVGWRTYLLKGSAILTDADVMSAKAMPDPNQNMGAWLVRVDFNEQAAKRFEQVTESNIKRRLAIMVDGRVQSAPVIQTKIPGGVVTITMGNGDPEQQRADAQRLEKALNGD